MIRTATKNSNQTLVSFDDHEETNRAILNSLLVVLKTRDSDTYDHSKRTVRLSLALGQECGLAPAQMRSLELGALLHDIGKIGVPDAVLRKPTKLNDVEWAMMRRHPYLGQEILRGLTFLQEARIIVAQHHEKWDGSGYPLGLSGEEIALSARVLFVADAFDAMTSNRVYRPAKSYEAAIAELDACSGTHFDPQVVTAFHDSLRRGWGTSHEKMAKLKSVLWEEARSPRSSRSLAAREFYLG